jgi:hypothetical protein
VLREATKRFSSPNRATSDRSVGVALLPCCSCRRSACADESLLVNATIRAISVWRSCPSGAVVTSGSCDTTGCEPAVKTLTAALHATELCAALAGEPGRVEPAALPAGRGGVVAEGAPADDEVREEGSVADVVRRGGPVVEVVVGCVSAVEVVVGGVPVVDVVVGDVPVVEVEVGDAPVVEVEVGDAPVVEVEVGDVPVVEVEVGDAPVVEVEVGDAPVVEVEVGDAPVVEVEVGDAPVVDVEVGDAPVVDVEVGDAPVVDVVLEGPPVSDAGGFPWPDCGADPSFGLEGVAPEAPPSALDALSGNVERSTPPARADVGMLVARALTAKTPATSAASTAMRRFRGFTSLANP